MLKQALEGRSRLGWQSIYVNNANKLKKNGSSITVTI